MEDSDIVAAIASPLKRVLLEPVPTCFKVGLTPMLLRA